MRKKSEKKMGQTLKWATAHLSIRLGWARGAQGCTTGTRAGARHSTGVGLVGERVGGRVGKRATRARGRGQGAGRHGRRRGALGRWGAGRHGRRHAGVAVGAGRTRHTGLGAAWACCWAVHLVHSAYF